MKKNLLSGLLGFAILLGCAIPPPIHWVTGPLGPFIGGFVAGLKARADFKGAATIGMVMGLLFSLFLALIFFALMSFQPSISGKVNEMLNSGELPLAPILGGAFAIITLMGTVSAFFGGKLGQKSAEDEPQKSPS